MRKGVDVNGERVPVGDLRVGLISSRSDHKPAVTSGLAGPVESGPVERAERELDQQVRALAAGAYHPERAADGLHPVPETDQPGSVGRIGSADAVVADVEPQNAAGSVDLGANV